MIKRILFQQRRSIQTLYTTQATSIGGRTGSVKSADGIIDLKLVTPKELGGVGGAFSNPEQLFASGYSACFLGAMGVAAREFKITLPPTTSSTAIVSIGKDETGLGLAVELKVKAEGIDKETLRKVVEKAHLICPYSKATRNNVVVTLSV